MGQNAGWGERGFGTGDTEGHPYVKFAYRDGEGAGDGLGVP